MTRPEKCEQLIHAINSAICSSADIAKALAALEFAGIEVQSLRITANFQRTLLPFEQGDMEFLRMLCIAQDLKLEE